MTAQEFEVLDELYFVVSFRELLQTLSWSEELLLDVLKGLAAQEYIKGINPASDEDITLTPEVLKQSYSEILFLATKKGLMEHNSRA